ncbi:MAG: hypothetical protein ACK5LF_25630 [Bacteroides xylanisolvens]
MAKKNIENNKIKGKTDIIKEIMIYVVAISTIFGIGYKTGCFYMEMKCTEKNIQTIGELQKDQEELKRELDICRNENSAITREEFEAFKKNFNEYNKKNGLKN